MLQEDGTVIPPTRATAAAAARRSAEFKREELTKAAAKKGAADKTVVNIQAEAEDAPLLATMAPQQQSSDLRGAMEGSLLSREALDVAYNLTSGAGILSKLRYATNKLDQQIVMLISCLQLHQTQQQNILPGALLGKHPDAASPCIQE